MGQPPLRTTKRQPCTQLQLPLTNQMSPLFREKQAPSSTPQPPQRRIPLHNVGSFSRRPCGFPTAGAGPERMPFSSFAPLYVRPGHNLSLPARNLSHLRAQCPASRSEDSKTLRRPQRLQRLLCLVRRHAPACPALLH